MSSPGSLQNLQDIVLPPPVPFWPPAPAWLILLGAVVLLLCFLTARAMVRYRRNAYRRAALAELLSASAAAEPLPLIATLLKRAALAACRREEVAGLTGGEWMAWLSKTSGLEVPEPVDTALRQGVYGGAAADPKALSAFAARWIRSHRGEPLC